MIDFYRELSVQLLSVISSLSVICGEYHDRGVYSNLWCV